MSTISTRKTIASGITLGTSGSYTSPLTITSTGAVIASSHDAIFSSDYSTVVNSGTVENTATAGYGVDIFNAGSVSNTGTGLIEGNGGIRITGSGTVTNSATIVGTGTVGYGVYIGAGGNVNNTGTGLIEGEFGGVSIFRTAGTVTNSATILATGTAHVGGVGVNLVVSGSVGNTGAGLIEGNEGVIIGNYSTGSGAGTVTNSARIIGTASYGVDIFKAGSVDNTGTGLIEGQNAGALIYGAGTVTNSGTIVGTGTASYGVTLGAGGSIDNTGLIEGYHGAIRISGSAGTVTNSASILGTVGPGVTLAAGGIVDNTGTGLIVGGVKIAGGAGTVTNSAGIVGAAGYGVFLAAGGTVVDSGTISGSTDAVYLGGTGGNQLELLPGYAFTGSVVVTGTANTLELGSAASAGTVSGIGTSFTDFATMTVEGGAQWTLAGSNMIGAGVALSVAGTLIALGTLTNAGTISGDVTLAGGGTLDNQAGGTIAAATIAVNGSGGAATVANAGTIIGTADVGVDLTAGGSVDNTGLIEGVFGVAISGAAGTVVDSGTISGTVVAVDLGGSSGNRLELLPGYALTGAVAVSGTANTLELGSAASAGTVSGIGTKFTDFATITVDPGARWTLAGNNNTLASGVTLTDLGTLILSGSLDNSDSISRGLTLATGARLTNEAGGTIGGGPPAAIFGNGGHNTVANLGTAVGSYPGAIGIDLTAGGTIVNGSTAITTALIAGGAGTAGAYGASLGGPGGAGGIGVNLAGGGSIGSAGTISGGQGGYGGDSGQDGGNGGTGGAGVKLSGGGSIANSGEIAGGQGATGGYGLIGGGGDGGAGGAGIDLAGAGTIGNSGTIAGGQGGTGGGVSTFGATGGSGGTGGVGVSLSNGGTIGNSGTIAGGQGGTGGGVSKLGATGGSGGTGGAGVGLSNGGSIGNSGTIAGGQGGIGGYGSSGGSGGAGVSLSGGGTIGNTGTIAGGAGGGGGSGYYGAGGAGGGGGAGVSLSGGGTIGNTGTIAGGSGGGGGSGYSANGSDGTAGAGIVLAKGGIVTNGSAGTAGALISGRIGIAGYGAAGVSVTNYGTIASTGGTAGTALQFANASSVLTLEGGSGLIGKATGAGGTLDLASADGAGTLTGLGTKYSGFVHYAVLAGASWTLTGANTIAGGVTLSDLGTLTNTGSLSGGGELVLDPATLTNSGSIGLGVTLSGGGYLDNEAGGTIAAAGKAVYGTGSAATVANAGKILAMASYGVDLAAGGSVDNTGTGLIEGHGGVFSGLFAPGTVSNSGTIIGTSGAGVRVRYGGSVDNAAGLIEGSSVGVYIQGGAGTISNSGTITGTTGVGVSLASGGTVVDSGTISGSTGAVSLGGTGGNLLGLESGYALSGAVEGSASATNTVELLGSAGAVTANYNSLSLTNFGTIAFGAASGNSEIWKITNAAKLPGTIAGFIAVQDTIELTGLAGGTVGNGGTVNGSDQLVVSNGTDTVTLQLDASDATVFGATADGGGTDVVFACFCRGTLIRSDKGEVAVEDLAIGDLVVTLSGEARPIKWIGHRAYDGRFVAANRAVLPICVVAGALADGVPARDLQVSPAHALYVDCVLAPAGLLANGATIRQVESVARLEYFHIELETHDVILAEGAPAESYVDCCNRGMFQNGGEYARLYPYDTPKAWQFCAPRLEEASGELVAIRAALLARAEERGHRLTKDPDPHLVADGVIARAESVAEEVYRFALPAGARALEIASRSAVPAEVEAASQDRRRLGVAVRRIVLCDGDLRIEIGPGYAGLSEGFHEDEGSHRWTDGLARLPDELLRPLAGAVTVEVHLIKPSLRYPLESLAPTAATAGLRRLSADPARPIARRPAARD